MANSIALMGFSLSLLGSRVVKIDLNSKLSAAERRQVSRLRRRDAAVYRRARTQLNAAGHHAVAAYYTYQLGPDGKRYAVDGAVQLDLTPVKGDPRATKQKAEQVRLAALAPFDVSAAERRMATKAALLAKEAQQELDRQNSAQRTDLYL